MNFKIELCLINSISLHKCYSLPSDHFQRAILKKVQHLCHKGYTDKNEKQVGCYVNLDSVKTFSDT